MSGFPQRSSSTVVVGMRCVSSSSLKQSPSCHLCHPLQRGYRQASCRIGGSASTAVHHHLYSYDSIKHCAVCCPFSSSASITFQWRRQKNVQNGCCASPMLIHRITAWPGLKRPTVRISTNPLLCAGSPTSSPGCPEPHPAWP